MAQVITFSDFRPIPRYDAVAWATANLEEGDTAAGPWTQIDTFTLTPADSDPENPALRNFTTELASDTLDLWYRFIFVDGTGDTEQATTPIQNTSAAQAPYATRDELQRVLKLNNPSEAQQVALDRVLLAAAGEIDTELDRASTDDALAGWQLALAAEVNLERAVEHWQQTGSPFGIVGLGDLGPTQISRDSWTRHALKLQPMKTQWGIA